MPVDVAEKITNSISGCGVFGRGGRLAASQCLFLLSETDASSTSLYLTDSLEQKLTTA